MIEDRELSCSSLDDEISSCYMCQSTKKSLVDGIVRDNPEINIYKCDECELVYLSKHSHINSSFYADSKMHDNLTLSQFEYWKNETCVDDNRRFKTLKKHIINKTLLDFGSGNGGFLSFASSVSKVAYGVEVDAFARNNCLDQGLNIYEQLENLPEKKFDVITLFHVLEHIQDPIALIKKLHYYLTGGGRLVIEVPSANDALLCLYKSIPFSHFTYWSPHLYLFNQTHLLKMARLVGFNDGVCQQVQRYSLSNHLYWLSQGKPGGHQHWSFLEDESLNTAYESKLGKLGLCDTLFAEFKK